LSDESNIKEMSIKEFQQSGCLLFINQILHIFGMAIVVETDNDGNCVRMYPARVNFRGFGEESTARAYKKISKYMVDNAEKLNNEANED